ncbi:hypothetical protein [Paenibacillus sp. GXUN7292]|uniref:hypothetical protein n=1 Tax=Paenibacillus sp. GXUN7292 TaxID=3422499 RepID=UPI003D7CB705
MEHRIILALGHDEWNNAIKKQLADEAIGAVVSIAHMRRNIVPRVMDHQATMVIASDMLLGDANDEDEWLSILEELQRIDLYFRFVFVCDRDPNDIFLSKLAYSGVTDIFLGNSFPQGWASQLRQSPKLENVERFRSKEDAVTEDLRKRKTRLKIEPEEILKQPLVPQASSHRVEKEIVTKTVREVVYEQVKIPPRTIAVVSLYEGAGSTTFTRMLAEVAATLDVDVGVCEAASPAPVWLDLLNVTDDIEKKYKGKWESWHRTLMKDDAVPAWSEVLRIEGVQYIVRHPNDDLSDWSESETAELLAYSKHVSLLFCDVSHHFDQSVEQIMLKSADAILLVSNYDPLRLSRSRNNYEKWLAKYADKTIIVMNKSTLRSQRANRLHVEQYFENKRVFHVPLLPGIAETFADGETVWGSGYLKEEDLVGLREEMDNILGELLGSEVFRKLRSRKRNGFVERIKDLFRDNDEYDAELDEGTV